MSDLLLRYLMFDELTVLVEVIPAVPPEDLVEFKAWAEAQLAKSPPGRRMVGVLAVVPLGVPQLQCLYGLLDERCLTTATSDQRWGMWNMLRTAVAETRTSLLRVVDADLVGPLLAEGDDERLDDLRADLERPADT